MYNPICLALVATDTRTGVMSTWPLSKTSLIGPQATSEQVLAVARQEAEAFGGYHLREFAVGDYACFAYTLDAAERMHRALA